MTENGVTNGHRDATAGVAHNGTADETVGGLHADAADATFTNLLSNFGRNGDELTVEVEVHFYSVVDLRQRVGRKLHVDNGTGDRDNAAGLQVRLLWCDGHW